MEKTRKRERTVQILLMRQKLHKKAAYACIVKGFILDNEQKILWKGKWYSSYIWIFFLIFQAIYLELNFDIFKDYFEFIIMFLIISFSYEGKNNISQNSKYCVLTWYLPVYQDEKNSANPDFHRSLERRINEKYFFIFVLFIENVKSFLSLLNKMFLISKKVVREIDVIIFRKVCFSIIFSSEVSWSSLDIINLLINIVLIFYSLYKLLHIYFIVLKKNTIFTTDYNRIVCLET